MTEEWQKLGKAKFQSINESIPKPWRLESPPSNEQQRDVTDDFVRQYLSKEEIEITESTATAIVGRTSTGQWTAEAVTKAFCHRASLAHQLVMKPLSGIYRLECTDRSFEDELLTRSILRCRYRGRQGIGRTLCNSRKTPWSSAWLTRQLEGSVPCEGC